MLKPSVKIGVESCHKLFSAKVIWTHCCYLGCTSVLELLRLRLVCIATSANQSRRDFVLHGFELA